MILTLCKCAMQRHQAHSQCSVTIAIIYTPHLFIIPNKYSLLLSVRICYFHLINFLLS